MRWYWKVLIGFCSLALLMVLFNIGLNLWIKYQLPKIINSDNNSAYVITFKSLKISFLDRTIFANEVILVPRATLSDTHKKSGIYSKVRTIEIRDFKIWNLLFSDKLKAKSITLERPELIVYKNKEKASILESVVDPFDKIISVSNVFLRNGDLKMINVTNGKVFLSVKNIQLELDDILITESILDNKIPFEFKDYKVSCDSIYYHSNAFYNIRTRKVNATKADIYIDNFEVIPQYSRRRFITKIPMERDLYTTFCKSIAANKIDWGFKEEDFFFHCNAVTINQAVANVYRSKEPVDNSEKRHLYSKLLRDLKFDLKVDTLKIQNSKVEYEEEKSSKIGPGKLSFGNFNLTATDICSGFKKEQKSDIKIKIYCRFMNASPLTVNWRFNVMDKSDGFRISGRLSNFDTEKIVSFTRR